METEAKRGVAMSCWRMIFACLVLLMPLFGCLSPLQLAALDGNTKTVLALLDQGVNVNGQDPDVNVSALHWAAWGGHLDTVRALLDRGAEVNAKTTRGSTPLHLAAYEGHTQIVQLLLERGADPSIKGKLCVLCPLETPLQTAERKGHTATAHLLRQTEAHALMAKQPPPSAPTVAAVPPAPAVPAIPASDVDTLPSAIAKPKKNAYAVVIGIEQYREKLPKADFADRDAKLVGEYLTKVLGYPAENVVVRLNERATRTDLVKYFEEWLRNNVDPGGSVFVYYSGHGAPNPKTGDAYLVPYDGDPAFVESTADPVKQLYAALEKLPAKEITVVLDSCFSGAGGRSVIARGMRPMVVSVENPILSSGKTVVLAASSGDQVSSTFEEKGHGLLTYFFLKGLQGEGDLNKDGAIEMAELFEYVKPNVQRVARRQYNNEQTPQLLASPHLLRKGGDRLAERLVP